MHILFHIWEAPVLFCVVLYMCICLVSSATMARNATALTHTVSTSGFKFRHILELRHNFLFVLKVGRILLKCSSFNILFFFFPSHFFSSFQPVPVSYLPPKITTIIGELKNKTKKKKKKKSHVCALCHCICFVCLETPLHQRGPGPCLTSTIGQMFFALPFLQIDPYHECYKLYHKSAGCKDITT